MQYTRITVVITHSIAYSCLCDNVYSCFHLGNMYKVNDVIDGRRGKYNKVEVRV